VLVFAVETLLAVVDVAEFVDSAVRVRRAVGEVEVRPHVVVADVAQDGRDADVVAGRGASER